jgi:hypothetical protein
VILSNEHVPVQGHHEIRNVGTHFDHFSKISNHDNFEVLNELSGENRGAKITAKPPTATGHGIKYKNKAVNAVELCVGTHVLVKIFLQQLFFVRMNSANDLPIEKKAYQTSAWNKNKRN